MIFNNNYLRHFTSQLEMLLGFSPPGYILQIFIRTTSKLEIQCQKGLYFSFDFGWYSIHIDIVCKEQGVGFFLLSKQNLLSLTKVICWWSLRDFVCESKRTPPLLLMHHKWGNFGCQGNFGFCGLLQLFTLLSACGACPIYFPGVKQNRLDLRFSWHFFGSLPSGEDVV